jgi:hypothetical protein
MRPQFLLVAVVCTLALPAAARSRTTAALPKSYQIEVRIGTGNSRSTVIVADNRRWNIQLQNNGTLPDPPRRSCDIRFSGADVPEGSIPTFQTSPIIQGSYDLRVWCEDPSKDGKITAKIVLLPVGDTNETFLFDWFPNSPEETTLASLKGPGRVRVYNDWTDGTYGTRAACDLNVTVGSRPFSNWIVPRGSAAIFEGSGEFATRCLDARGLGRGRVYLDYTRLREPRARP